MGQKSKKILLEINAIETEGQVGVEVIRVKLKLSEACLMPVMLRGEINKVERMQSKTLKKLLEVPKSASNT